MPSSQTHRRKNSKEDSKSFFLLLILLLGAGAFYLLGIQEEKPIRTVKREVSAYSQEANQKVNDHLAWTNKKIELQARKRALENYSTPQVGDSIISKDNKDYGVDHSADTNESTAYQDLNRDRHELRATDPDRVIRNQIYDQDAALAYEQAYREEYARQFVENARMNGYEVRLNDDFVVQSVKKIRNPSNAIIGPQAR